MRNGKSCPKCQSSEVVRIPHATWAGSGFGAHYAMDTIAVGRSVFSAVKLTRYLCGACGFTEEWVDSQTKGDSLYVEGAISIAEWESAGEKRHALSVRVAKAETPSIGQNKKAKTETRVGDEARASSAG